MRLAESAARRPEVPVRLVSAAVPVGQALDALSGRGEAVRRTARCVTVAVAQASDAHAHRRVAIRLSGGRAAISVALATWVAVMGAGITRHRGAAAVGGGETFNA